MPRDMTVVAYVRRLVESQGLMLGARARERWQALADHTESLLSSGQVLLVFGG